VNIALPAATSSVTFAVKANGCLASTAIDGVKKDVEENHRATKRKK
jgi:hypothetical protein